MGWTALRLHALGRFFDKAMRSSYWDPTVFLVVADHNSLYASLAYRRCWNKSGTGPTLKQARRAQVDAADHLCRRLADRCWGITLRNHS